MHTSNRRLLRWLKVGLGICLVFLVVMGAGLAIVIFRPDVAAQNIDRLRDILGDAPVAQLESAALSIQDQARQWEYQVGFIKPAAPWSASYSATVISQPTSTPFPDSTPATPAPEPVKRVLSTPTPVPDKLATSVTSNAERSLGSPTASATTQTATALQTSNGSAWQLLPLLPLGKLPGEGQWSPYLQTGDGQTTVAYRAFLQADPKRPYSVIAIVAFDLHATRLHFVLGTVEPIPAKPQPSRTGKIATADLRAGVLLATFNGGFKARHGWYGAMAAGLTALPAIKGLATVAIHADGQVQIGEWGTDIKDSRGLLAWRQNGKLLVHNGEITPETAYTTEPWGLTIKGEAVTWRSALGISAAGRTLYYVAGQELDVPTLAKVMTHIGAAEALQLDVNNFWVHFAAIRSQGSSLVAEPLLDAMKLQVDRYLKSSDRDFFYVTTNKP